MTLQIQKFAPIDRDGPIFEVLSKGQVILDIALEPSGAVVTFHGHSSSIPLDELLATIEQVRAELRAIP